MKTFAEFLMRGFPKPKKCWQRESSEVVKDNHLQGEIHSHLPKVNGFYQIIKLVQIQSRQTQTMMNQYRIVTR